MEVFEKINKTSKGAEDDLVCEIVLALEEFIDSQVLDIDDTPITFTDIDIIYHERKFRIRVKRVD